LSPARAWAALAAGLAIGAVVARFVPAAAIDWQPGLAASQPWRAWSAAAVHYSNLHLAANLAGAALVAWLGAAAQVRGAQVVAWSIAWPLTQFGLLLRPELAHYGGLSGVLHAGVAIAALQVLVNDPLPRRRLIGAAILVLLLAKVTGESPWGPALAHPAGWDIAVAPFAHASGLGAGLLCGAIAAAIGRARRAG
jgi:rhomboid family GlyGly-CTERM serine protease